MTPGPTSIRENVRDAMKKPITNPDLDPAFYTFYKGICEKLQKLLNTQNMTVVLSGEGILGLEAACASLIEPDDRILCIENGIFGAGFGDFAAMYGGKVDFFHGDRRKGLDLDALRVFIENHHDYKVATLVHCETPSGITNPIGEICKLLHEYNILTVVDAVSSIGGEELYVDDWHIDIALGGSQKCLSAPPGLTFLSISPNALKAMNTRKQPIRGFYTNLSLWQSWYEDQWFPYTQPISELYAFDAALNNALADTNIIHRHRTYGYACRKALENCGLELFAQESWSNTVTTVLIPENIKYSELFHKMFDEHHIMIAGGFDFLKDKVFRIGHMGENCYEEKLYLTLKALNQVLRELGVELKKDLHKEFVGLLC